MPEDSRLQAQAIDGTDASQYISQGAGQAETTAPTATATTVGTTAQAATPITQTANTIDNIAQSADSLAGTLSQNQAAQGAVGDSSLLTVQYKTQQRQQLLDSKLHRFNRRSRYKLLRLVQSAGRAYQWFGGRYDRC